MQKLGTAFKKGAVMLLLIHIVNGVTFTINPNWQDTKILMGSVSTRKDGLLFLVGPRGYRKPCTRARHPPPSPTITQTQFGKRDVSFGTCKVSPLIRRFRSPDCCSALTLVRTGGSVQLRSNSLGCLQAHACDTHSCALLPSECKRCKGYKF